MKKTPTKNITTFKELCIPKPCHENWERMSIVERERLCGKCNKTVYDFTERSVEEFNRLHQEKKKAFCVRFYEEDINQDLRYEYQAEKNNWNSFAKYFRYIVAIIAIKASSLRMSYGQNNLLSKADSFGNTVSSTLPDTNEQRVGRESAFVKGKVVKKNSEGYITGATVKLFDQKGGFVSETITSDSGKFYMSLPDTLNLNQSFIITAEKEKRKTPWVINKYSKDKKEIKAEEFSQVILQINSRRRLRREGFLGLGGKRKPIIMGKFR
jgi:hypothetical protein